MPLKQIWKYQATCDICGTTVSYEVVERSSGGTSCWPAGWATEIVDEKGYQKTLFYCNACTYVILQDKDRSKIKLTIEE